MKKLIPLFVFMLLLLLPAAQAEDAAPYVPGSMTEALFSQAYDQGDMLLMDVYYHLKTNESAPDILGEDAAVLSAISEALKNTVFTLGFGKAENGVRALLAAEYISGDEHVEADILAELTRDGLAIMSSAIPNERFTAKWETMLALAGASETEIAQILSLRDVDWNSVLTELAAQSAAMLEAIASIAAPYGETIMAHISALPTDVRTDVPEENGFPASATEVCITITQKALGDLTIALADQLEQDTTLCVILDAVLSESGEEMTTEQLCQSVREAAAGLTDESLPVYIYVGMDENDDFIYLNIFLDNKAGETVLLSVIATPYAEDENLSQFSIDLLALAADETIQDGVSIMILASDAQAETAALQLYADVYASGETVLSTELYQSTAATRSEDGLRGIDSQLSMSFAGTDGEDMLSAAFSVDAAQRETVEGGEQSSAVGSAEIAVDDIQLPTTFEVYSLTETGEAGPMVSLSSLCRMPLLGIDEYMEGYTFYTAEYAPDMSTVSELALETASQDALLALGQRAMTSLEETMARLLELLPPALTEGLEMSDAL